MPTLPLMNVSPDAHPDAPRRVTAPGGYEWWGFDASGDDGRLHLVARLYVGHALDSPYARRYARYRRRPTRFAPPKPTEHLAVTFALLEAGRPALRFVSTVSTEDLAIADDGRSIRLGASHSDRGADGVIRLQLRGHDRDRTIAVNLSFRPQVESTCAIDLVAPPATEDDATEPKLRRGHHGWLIASPLCDVDGQVTVISTETAAAAPRVIAFAGSGCHDHRFGTRPLGEAAGNWLSGRAVFEDRAVLFQVVGDGDESFVCTAAAKDSAAHVARRPVKTIGGSSNRWGVSFPESIELPGDVRLLRPRVVGSTFATVTVAYDAVGDLETGRALVQVVKPKRLVIAP